METFKERNAYPDAVFYMRKKFLNNVYGIETDLSEQQLSDRIRQEDLWVVVRAEELKSLKGTFRAASLPLVFESSKQQFHVYHGTSTDFFEDRLE